MARVPVEQRVRPFPMPLFDGGERDAPVDGRSPGAQDDGSRVWICVLASSSSGNCSVLVRESASGLRRVTMIDAGLSPRRTNRLLHDLGLSIDLVDDVLLTHLDRDHCHLNWGKFLPRHTAIRLHRRHIRRAERMALLSRRTEVFDRDGFDLGECATVWPLLLSHDSLGVAAFRFDLAGGASLGFATDVGKPTQEMVEHLRGVSTLAIESNYCPAMQHSSARPEYLKHRIMGGSGHLSNEQCARMVRAIAPSEHVVLLHLSRECNSPEKAAQAHNGAPYALTVARHDAPTGLIPVAGAPA